MGTLCVSLFRYLLCSSISSKRTEPKKWKFYYYFVRFMNDNELIYYVDNTQQSRSKALGLYFVRQICSQYNLKSGPYSRVKKEINVWCYNTFGPTIFGWWYWRNRSLKQWIPFPKELKMYF